MPATPETDVTGQDWLERYAAELGVDVPDAASIDALLKVASVAAHRSERWAAPVSSWLAASAGVAPDRALALAERLAADG